MLRRISLMALVVGLACPAAASAGGYATVGLHSLPQGTEPGETWTAEFTVLAHGRTPFVGGKPTVIVSRAGGDEVWAFPARAAGEPGVYRAEVDFPASGRFEYAIDDGYSQRHTFPPVTIGAESTDAAATPAGDDGGPSLPLALALAAGAGLLSASLVATLSRRLTGGEPALGA